MRSIFDGYLTDSCSKCEYWADGTDDRGFGCAIPFPIMWCGPFAEMFEKEQNQKVRDNNQISDV